jgi:hypothetical protein
MFNVHPLLLFSIGSQSQFWDLNNAAENENIILSLRSGSQTQNWGLISVFDN